jgi:hypothetical protein
LVKQLAYRSGGDSKMLCQIIDRAGAMVIKTKKRIHLGKRELTFSVVPNKGLN